jgi:hypothetical protein
MNDKQREALKRLCERYKVPFEEENFHTYPADSWMMPLWAEGWIGDKVYVGCSPEGDIHS